MQAESLRIWSFHSVKGGVGKSTLSWLAARALARQRPRVLLIDFDLTGTSLADAVELRAPIWQDVSDGERLPLDRAPDDFTAPMDLARRLRARERESVPHARNVPFLNDFLLWEQPADWGGADALPSSIAWRLPERDELVDRLEVLPSSALPRDLNTVLALLYDEPFCGWVESRVEWLLDSLLRHTTIRDIVIDTPPTIPGLSRAILSVAMRLTEPGGKISLAETGRNPETLWGADVRWRPWIVSSDDVQDLRAVFRYVQDHDQGEMKRLGLVINRTAYELPALRTHLASVDERGLEDDDAEAREANEATIGTSKRQLFDLDWGQIERVPDAPICRVFRLGVRAGADVEAEGHVRQLLATAEAR